MNSEKRWLKSVLKEVQKTDLNMPWTRSSRFEWKAGDATDAKVAKPA